jgi:hypothetical protein
VPGAQSSNQERLQVLGGEWQCASINESSEQTANQQLRRTAWLEILGMGVQQIKMVGFRLRVGELVYIHVIEEQLVPAGEGSTDQNGRQSMLKRDAKHRMRQKLRIEWAEKCVKSWLEHDLGGFASLSPLPRPTWCWIDQ